MIPSKYGTAVVRNKKYPILQHCKHWLNMAEDDDVLKWGPTVVFLFLQNVNTGHICETR